MQQFIHLDMRNDEKFDETYHQLLRGIYNEPEIIKPTLGQRPSFHSSGIENKNVTQRPDKEETVKKSTTIKVKRNSNFSVDNPLRFRLSLNGKETPILLNNNELSTVIKIKPGNYDIMVIYEEQDNIDGWGHLLPEHDIESNTISKNLNANMLYEFEFGTYYKQLYLSSDLLLKLTDEFQFE